MTLLRQTPDSVLWLLADNRWVTENLARAAQGHGIDPERLVFAPKVPLERAPCALHDRRPCARHFSVRIAHYRERCAVGGLSFGWIVRRYVRLASVGQYTFRVQSAGAHHLHAWDYERLALKLATDESYRNTLRARLAIRQDSTSPLFDSTAFTRDLEQLYLDLAGANPG